MDYRELGWRLMMLNVLRRGFVQEATADCALYRGQLPVLEAILQAPDTTQAALAEQLHVTPASVALSAKRLEKSGFVERRIDPDNRRRNMLRATESGRLAAAACRCGFDAADARMFGALSEAEQETLCSLLDRMIAGLSEGRHVELCPMWKEKKHD